LGVTSLSATFIRLNLCQTNAIQYTILAILNIRFNYAAQESNWPACRPGERADSVCGEINSRMKCIFIMRILHTADLHLKNPATPEGARRLGVLGEICRLARGYDALVIAGDLFDSAGEAQYLEGALRGLFTELRPASVLIIPGNHDLLRGDNPFDGRYDFGQSGNVRLLASAPFEVFRLGPASFYGFPFKKASSTTELFRQAGGPAPGEIKIALLHGITADRAELAGWAFDPENAEEGGEAVIKDVDLRAAGFSYAALGHIHRAASWSAGDCLASYPGSPESVRVTESGQRTVNSVSFDGETGRAGLERVPLSTALSARREYVFVFPGDETALPDRLDALLAANREGKLLSVVLEGIADLNRVREAAAAAKARWKGRLSAEPEFSLRLEDSQPRASDMIMYAFLRKTRDMAAAADTPERQDLVRRITALGWRSLTARSLDPEELLDR